VDDLGISARELRALLRISNRTVPAKEYGERLDDVIAGIHTLLPFTHCVVLHERLQQSHTLAFVYQREHGLSKRIGATRQGDPRLQLRHYVQAFSRFGTFQNAFFWYHRARPALMDRGVAEALWHVELTEGIAGGVNLYGGKHRESATLVQLQYSQDQFAAKHLVFANLIANCLHSYFEQGEVGARQASRASGAGWASGRKFGSIAPAGRAH
jgi:hypothetical protein